MSAPVPAPTQPLLRLQNIRTIFETNRGQVLAAQRVSLDVGHRQALGVVGESGSGKTQSFLSTLALSHGLPGVVAGSASFNGESLLDGIDRVYGANAERGIDARSATARAREWRREHRARTERLLGTSIALMSQDPKRSLIPYWTVGRHLQEILQRSESGVSVRRRSEELLKQLGFAATASILAAYAQQLSGGEAQRVMLALAMAVQPKLLIADEPTTALDAINQQRVLHELKRMHETIGLSLVLISHDIGVVRSIADYLVVFLSGYVVERAPIAMLDSLEEDRVHPYTVALIASQRRRAEGLPLLDVAASHNQRPPTSGCPYAHRCSRRPTLDEGRRAQCAAEAPPEFEVAPRHSVACWAFAP